MPVTTPARFEDGLGYLVHHLMYAFRQRLACHCAREGYSLTSDECAVLMLLSQEGALSHGRMAETLAKDKAALTRLVSSLQRAGLVQRQTDARDRRAIRVSLTDRGKAAASSLRRVIEELHRRIYAGIDEKEFELCRDVLARILENIRAMEQEEAA